MGAVASTPSSSGRHGLCSYTVQTLLAHRVTRCPLIGGGPGKGAPLARLTLGVASTFPPREDGIATFTRDLLSAVCRTDAGISARIAAITDRGSSYAYPRQVHWQIVQDDKASYAAAGRAL